MGIRLVTGPVGSGKTAKAVAEFADLLKADPAGAARSLRYIVPTTRAAREIERQVMDLTGLSGIIGNVICTFYKFADEVIAESGLASALISDSQRLIVLKELVSNSPLDYFRASAQYPGFVHALEQIIGELKVSMVTPEALADAAEAAGPQLGPASKTKVCELTDLYRRYQQEILMSHSLHDREGVMWRALEIMRNRASDSGLRHVVIDGFSDMNGVQMEFLRTITESASEVLVILDWEHDRPEVFGSVGPTRDFILSLGASEEMIPRSSCEPDPLRHVEAQVFRRDAPSLSPGCAVCTIEGGSPVIEVELIAEEIRKLVRDEGYAFGDIALIGRDTEGYRARIERIFPEYGIPVDASDRPLAGTALARMLMACISAVRGGWQRPEVIRLLKSEFLGAGDAALRNACRVEVEARQRAVFDGKSRWLSKWKEDDDLLEFRAQTLAPVAQFQDALNSSGTLTECVAATASLLESLGLRKYNDALLAEDSAAKNALVAILRDLVEAARLLGRSIERTEFLDLLQTAVNAAEYPAAASTVNILSTNELGVQKFQVVFVIGLLEKVFPRQISEDSFLRDSERTVLNPRLTGTLRLASHRQEAERTAFYTAVSSATERLFLCYPLADEAAKDSLPSFYVDEVRKLFDTPLPSLHRNVSDLIPRMDDAQSRGTLKRSLLYTMAHSPGGDDELAWVYRGLSEDEADVIENCVALAADRDAEVRCNVLLTRLAGGSRVYTCTELENYAACPFMHYCSHTLHLDPIRDEVGALDHGGILHQVLYRVFTYFRERNGGPTALSELQIAEVISLANQLFNDEFDNSTRLRNLPEHEKDLTRRKLWTYVRRYLRSEHRCSYPGFVPQYFELQFGRSDTEGRDFDPHSTERTLSIPCDGGPPVRIMGKMDRLDVSKDGAMIIDYKTGTGTDIKGFEKGLVLQAMAYALAVRDLFGMTPVGTEYRPIRKWDPKGYYIDSTGIGKKSNTFTGDEFSAKLGQCEQFVGEIANGIRQGRIGVVPRDCKNYCTFRPICRIDRHKLLKLKHDTAEEVAE